MWLQRASACGGLSQFFSIIVDSGALAGYYATNSNLMLHYNYSLTELEDMIPWEREIYVCFVEQHIKEKNEKIEQANSFKGGGRIVTP